MPDRLIPTYPRISCSRVCSGGGIGRHARLRGVCREVCWFESSPEHHFFFLFLLGQKLLLLNGYADMPFNESIFGRSLPRTSTTLERAVQKLTNQAPPKSRGYEPRKANADSPNLASSHRANKGGCDQSEVDDGKHIVFR